MLTILYSTKHLAPYFRSEVENRSSSHKNISWQPSFMFFTRIRTVLNMFGSTNSRIYQRWHNLECVKREKQRTPNIMVFLARAKYRLCVSLLLVIMFCSLYRGVKFEAGRSKATVTLKAPKECWNVTGFHCFLKLHNDFNKKTIITVGITILTHIQPNLISKIL